MKYLVWFFFTLLGACSPLQNEEGYDEKLATELGANEMGFKIYVLCLLKPGKPTILTQTQSDSFEIAHLAYLNPLMKNKQIVMAGYFNQSPNLSGLLVFDVKNIEEAQELMKYEPKLVKGILMAEYHNWMSTAALPLLFDEHMKITKTPL